MSHVQALPPLSGLRVIDFSTLLPGPLASLLLAEAGADVIKVERTGGGDEMRSYAARFGTTGANFALLNRGKRTLVADLKRSEDLARVLALVRDADVLIEQFRPGVMDRLGLGHRALEALNPRLIYCSITGHGQHGALAGMAGHDLNYLAQTGLLDLCRDATGRPGLPPVLAADIAGGAYPAVINILLAWVARQACGHGRHLDVAMSGNLYTLAYWGLASGLAEGKWPRPGGELVTGGSPRYALYATADGRFLAVAAIEERFWQTFCDILGLPGVLRDDSVDPRATRDAVAQRIGERSAVEWERVLAGLDCCVCAVASLEQAVRATAASDPALFGRWVEAADGRRMPALPVPLDRSLQHSPQVVGVPELDAAEPPAWRPLMRAPTAA